MSEINLMQGDCLERMKEIPDGSVDSIITDPPFNIVEKIGSNIHIFRQAEQHKDASITRESMSFDSGFDQMSWLEFAAKKLKKGGSLIIFNDWENMGDIAKELRRLKLKVKCLNHWQKTNPCPAEWGRRFVAGREYFIHATKGSGYSFNVERLHKGCFEMPLTKKSEKAFGKHPNQKPAALMEQIIDILTDKNHLVLDPFMGSGTTGVAAKKLDRDFIGIELDANYFEIAKTRIENA